MKEGVMIERALYYLKLEMMVNDSIAAPSGKQAASIGF